MSAVLVACGATPAPLVIRETEVVAATQVVRETVVVEQEGETVAEEVTHVVEKEVTATPEPQPAGGEVVLEGEIQVNDGQQVHVIPAGHAAIIPPGDPHEVTGTHRGVNARYLVVTIPPAWK